jgi:5-methylcytosine-specific restriction endonuclease McrA
MKLEHGIPPVDGFNLHLKEKYCPKCKKVKSLSSFAKLQDQEKVYFSWCNDCNLERNIARNVADHDFDLFQYLVIRLSFSDKCFICNISHDESIEKLGEPLHVDHMHAFAKGGELSMSNSILLCKDCNLKKGTKELATFLRETGSTDSFIESKLLQLATIHNWAEVELKRVLKRSIYKNQNPNNAIIVPR